jgi:hypothetical protein
MMEMTLVKSLHSVNIWSKIRGSVTDALYKATNHTTPPPPCVEWSDVVVRDLHGIALLFQYYNHLYYVERRFFPPDRSLGIYFEW